MRTLEYLTNPSLGPFVRPALVGAVGASLMCGLLSPLVVLKRMSFIGQGVSHAAFGGVGLAFAIGVTGVVPLDASAGAAARADLALMALVLAYCAVTALGMARLGRRGEAEADTAIGIVLVGSMALGSVAVALAAARASRLGLPPPPSIDSVLFGSFTTVSWAGAVGTWVGLALIIGVLFALRRPMLFWAFDEPVAVASGVRAGLMRHVLHILLALAIVLTMRLAGVILATALLVLPGAAALRLSRSLPRVIAISLGLGLLGVLGGLVASIEFDLPPGACIVFVEMAILSVATLASHTRARSAP
ncbi:MAG: metal ABC transporter permease [Phycisphaerales bacterium]|nr:metal ABC transporter permease [Phycisphaerales bacterium]